MNASDIMSRQVITISPADTVLHAIKIMLEHRISGLPVTDASGHLIGMVTEGDFLRRSETATERKRPRWLEVVMSPGRLADQYVLAHGRTVREIMTPDVQTVTPDTPLADVVQLMEQQKIKRVPVTVGEQLVGLITRADLVGALAKALGSTSKVTQDDDSICRQIIDEINRQPWGPRATIHVAVADGVVNLTGAIFDERERQALRVMAENIPGVRRVHDEIAFIEPLSGVVLDAPPDDSAPPPRSAR